MSLRPQTDRQTAAGRVSNGAAKITAARRGRIRPLQALFLASGILAALGLGWAVLVDLDEVRDGSGDPDHRQVERTLATRRPPLPQSSFLNTQGAGYVGSDRCVACHEAEYDSFRQSGMGRSAARVDPAEEPPGGIVEHLISQRMYKVERDKRKLHHREFLWWDNADLILLVDHAVKYRVGSGRHARTYLAEIDGFLVESPISWFAAEQSWRMSPGYDVPNQQGFERGVGQDCLRCHTGRSEPIGATLHKMSVLETWISCERCHGPGELHVAEHSGSAAPNQAKMDRTIVNPAHLDRQLSDDICAQCHLHAAASVPSPHRQLDDYRPGLPLDAFRIDYRAETAATQMTVVGHVGQLRQSRCYQHSDMSCTTCHNPHDRPTAEERVPYYRSTCLTCHASHDCTSPGAKRQRTRPADNCIECHMPSSQTEVRHVALTHHRIGVHSTSQHAAIGRLEAPADAPVDLPVELAAGSSLSGLTPGQRLGALGVAYDDYSQEEGAPLASWYQDRAYRLLRQAWESGEADALMAGRLALLGGQRGDPDVARYAEFVLSRPGASAGPRTDALLARANHHRNRGNLADALQDARLLTQLRRNWGDWLLVAAIEQESGRLDEMVEAFEVALSINSQLVDVRRLLVEHYQAIGNFSRLQYHQTRLPPSP